MTFLRGAVSCLAVVALVGGSCGGRKQAPQGKTKASPCKCGADAGPSRPRARLAVAAPSAGARPVSGRRLQHFALLAAARSYRDHRSCVALVNGSLPPELTREADPANLALRICQTRRALAEKSAALCEEIHDPFWPRACRRLFATLYGKPDACPHRRLRHQGRDAACVALATRDPALCRAVRSLGGQQRCRAILGPASGCRALRTTAEVRSCELDRKRWRSVLRPAKPSLAEKYAPRYELTLTTGGKTLRGASRALDHGVVLPKAKAGGRWMLGAMQPTGVKTAIDRQLAVLIDLPPVAKLPAILPVGAAAKGARLCALWKGRPVLPKQARGKVVLTAFEVKRGTRILGTYKVEITRGGETVTVAATFDTFVRDTVPGAWATTSCAERLASQVRVRAAPPSVAPTGEPEGRPCHFVAHWKGLGKVGYRVYGVRPKGSCARLGLKKDDVMVALGARPTGRWVDVLELYRRLASGKPLAITVLRRGKRLVLKIAGR